MWNVTWYFSTKYEPLIASHHVQNVNKSFSNTHTHTRADTLTHTVCGPVPYCTTIHIAARMAVISTLFSGGPGYKRFSGHWLWCQILWCFLAMVSNYTVFSFIYRGKREGMPYVKRLLLLHPSNYTAMLFPVTKCPQPHPSQLQSAHCHILPSYTVPTVTSFPVTHCPLPHPSQLHGAHCHTLPSFTVPTATSFPVTQRPQPHPSQLHSAHSHILPSYTVPTATSFPVVYSVIIPTFHAICTFVKIVMRAQQPLQYYPAIFFSFLFALSEWPKKL